MNVRPAFAALAALILLALALAPASAQDAETQEASGYSDAEARRLLRADLDGLEDFCRTALRAAVDAAGRHAEREDRNLYDDWLELTIGLFEEALDNDAPRVALVDSWAYAEGLVADLTGGEDRELFGAGQELVLNAAQRILTRVELIASEYLPEEQRQQVQDRIKEHVRDNPLKGASLLTRGLSGARDQLFSAVGVGSDVVSTVVSIPLMPQRVVSDVGRGTEGLSAIGESSRRIADVLETLPEDVRRELEALIERLAQDEEKLSRLLQNAQGVTGDVNEAMTAAGPVSENVNAATGNLRETAPEIREAAALARDTARESRALVEAIQALRARDEASSPTEPRGRPFDVTEYEEAALAIERGAVSVREMLETIQDLRNAGGEGTDQSDGEDDTDIRDYQRAAEAVERAAGEIRATLLEVQGLMQQENNAEQIGRDFVDHVFVRAAQLAGVVFVLALLFVWISRFRRRRKE